MDKIKGDFNQAMDEIGNRINKLVLYEAFIMCHYSDIHDEASRWVDDKQKEIKDGK